MSFRVIGKRWVEQSIYEQFCDQCGSTIETGKYPEISLTLNGEGALPEHFIEKVDFCSWPCLIAYACDQNSD